MENIECHFNLITQDYTCEIPYLEKIEIGGVDNFVNNSWSNGDLFISFLLVFGLIYCLGKDILKLFYPERVIIKRYID